MKILIAYDGSECGDAALDDLPRAGLPDKVEALVMSVADVFLPPPINEKLDNTFPFYLPAGVKRAHERAAQAVTDARILSERASDRLRNKFPVWDVRPYACAESPAWGVILQAGHEDADLIVVGSHGHSDLGGRLILGSVSQRILYEAPCSVRVARRNSARNSHDAGPVSLVIGTDGSPDSQAAVAAVAARAWPSDTEVKLVTVLDTVLSITPNPAEPEVVKWIETDNETDIAWLHEFFEASAATLRAAGLKASTIIRKGNPKSVLVAVAKDWSADCIFVGAKGLRGIERFLLGSVASAVSARAHCSVEVVRRKVPAGTETANSPD